MEAKMPFSPNTLHYLEEFRFKRLSEVIGNPRDTVRIHSHSHCLVPLVRGSLEKQERKMLAGVHCLSQLNSALTLGKT